MKYWYRIRAFLEAVALSAFNTFAILWTSFGFILLFVAGLTKVFKLNNSEDVNTWFRKPGRLFACRIVCIALMVASGSLFAWSQKRSYEAILDDKNRAQLRWENRKKAA